MNYKKQHARFRVRHTDDEGEDLSWNKKHKTKKSAIEDMESRSGYFIEELDE